MPISSKSRVIAIGLYKGAAVSEITNKADLIAQYSEKPLDVAYLRLIAHDVRNWMNTIMMASDILKEELKGVEGKSDKYVGMIGRASEEILIILEAAVQAQKKTD